MSIASAISEPRIALSNTPWPTYIALRGVPENCHIPMTYDQGILELMSPSKSYERLSYLLGRLIDVWTEERSIPVQSCRSTTFRREDLQKGLEPDNCYYVAHEAAVRHRDEIDLSLDPPPDLAVEIDITFRSIERLPIYAALGVPEVWRWSREQLEIFQLSPAGNFRPAVSSMVLPDFPILAAADLLQRRGEIDETSRIQSFRRLIRHPENPDRDS